MAERVVENKSYAFAVKVVKFVRELKKETREYELLTQLMRSGTSIGANVSEATFAQGDKDFLFKHRIALKEATETRYWLKLLRDTEIVDESAADEMIKDVSELISILVKIIQTTQKKIEKAAKPST